MMASDDNDKKPKRLTSKRQRQRARYTRDSQWEFAEKVARLGTVWFCWWDKDGRHKAKPPSDDLHVLCLITGMELLEWLNSHPDWWVIGEWSDEHYAAPVQMTDTGREALAHRHLYDMESVTGGMVEPGRVCTPLPRKKVSGASTV